MDPESVPWPDEASASWPARAPGSAPGDKTAAERWLAEARADELIAERRARTTHTFLAVRETTLTGALTMAAEHGDEVALWTRSERQIAGTVSGAGPDWVSIDGPRGRSWVALAAVDRVMSPHRRVGARQVTGPVLMDVLADQVSAGDEVIVWTAGRAHVTGRFAGCGRDVVLIDAARGRTLVGAQSLEVVLVGSG